MTKYVPEWVDALILAKSKLDRIMEIDIGVRCPTHGRTMVETQYSDMLYCTCTECDHRMIAYTCGNFINERI